MLPLARVVTLRLCTGIGAYSQWLIVAHPTVRVNLTAELESSMSEFLRRQPRLRLHRPWVALLFLIGAAVALFLLAAAISGAGRILACGAGLFYAGLSALTLHSWYRITRNERPLAWNDAERLLIVAPHQDDCVIAAGGIGLRNIALGGETRVVYLYQEQDVATAQCRAEEAKSAWRIAGLEAVHLLHLDLLPPITERDPKRLYHCQEALASIIESFRPTVIVLPMFEGGHVHHDVVNHLLTSIVTPAHKIRMYEAPEYSPFVSLTGTPHKIIALCTRWLLFASYYGPPDCVDDRIILVAALSKRELHTKVQMLSVFASQNPAALIRYHGHRDRFVIWHPRPYRARPFDVGHWLFVLIQDFTNSSAAGLARKLIPNQSGTIGRQPYVTDLDLEFGVASSPLIETTPSAAK
jgi:LmbE family N-acetylglucosaminyl deacetylase